MELRSTLPARTRGWLIRALNRVGTPLKAVRRVFSMMSSRAASHRSPSWSRTRWPSLRSLARVNSTRSSGRRYSFTLVATTLVRAARGWTALTRP